jgi:hypothetical protein
LKHLARQSPPPTGQHQSAEKNEAAVDVPQEIRHILQRLRVLELDLDRTHIGLHSDVAGLRDRNYKARLTQFEHGE